MENVAYRVIPLDPSNVKSTIPTTIMFYARLFFPKEKELVEYFCWSLYIRISLRYISIIGRTVYRS